MDAAPELLDVVDDNDSVVGRSSRLEIHQKGLLHRQIHVLLATPAGDIIFQKRASGKLDAAVGGHVSAGQDYLAAALREIAEETSLTLASDDLILLGKVTYDEVFDHPVKPLNRGFMCVYGYVFRGDITALTMADEQEAGAVFVSFPLAEVLARSPALKTIIPRLIEDDYMGFYRRLVELARK